MAGIPLFRTEAEEAEFWDQHSPLDFIPEPVPEKVTILKDQLITFRLDSQSRLKLEKLARSSNLGPSTLARLLVMSALKSMADKNEPH